MLLMLTVPGIWLFSDDRQSLNRFAVHDENTPQIRESIALKQIDYPDYFDAINNHAVVKRK